jgi:hypothetical protein
MCDQLIRNTSLREFLTLVLQIGNCLNAVSTRNPGWWIFTHRNFLCSHTHWQGEGRGSKPVVFPPLHMIFGEENEN